MRLGFLGTGWIGRNRLEAIARSGAAEIAGIADPSEENAEAARASAPGAVLTDSLEGLLDLDVDGVVIATPSALHAEQAVTALARGAAVFCQKPVGRTAAETRAVVDRARRSDRLLGVDFSYRTVEAARRVRDLVTAGELGRIYAADLVFHNAYGPDKPWFYDPERSGGGCVIDLGIHLVDLALWVLGFPEVSEVSAHLFAGGWPLRDRHEVEDYAVATLITRQGLAIRLACSWNLSAGQDAVIGAEFFGTAGSAALRNVRGSFYDFVGERRTRTARYQLCGPPDDWGGRASVEWARRLSAGARFDPEADRLVTVARVIDAIYERATA